MGPALAPASLSALPAPRAPRGSPASEPGGLHLFWGSARGPDREGPLRSLSIQASGPSRCPPPGSSPQRQSLICSRILNEIKRKWNWQPRVVPGNGDLCSSGVGNCVARRAGGAEPRQALFAGLLCYSLLLGSSGGEGCNFLNPCLFPLNVSYDQCP